jgi:hypothetical protein
MQIDTLIPLQVTVNKFLMILKHVTADNKKQHSQDLYREELYSSFCTVVSHGCKFEAIFFSISRINTELNAHRVEVLNITHERPNAHVHIRILFLHILVD